MNNGYWFLLTLFSFRISLIISKIFTSKAKIRNEYVTYILMLILELAFAILYGQIHKFQYSIFYIGGIWLSQEGRLKTLQKKDTMLGLCFLFSIIAYIIAFTYNQTNNLLCKTLVKIALTTFLFITISKGLFTGRLERYMSCLGKRSLDLYVIHYFFIIPFSNNPIVFFNNIMIQDIPEPFIFVIACIICFIITLLSLAISKILHSNAFLEKYTLGKFK